MLVFLERGKPEYPEKSHSEQGDNQQQTQPAYEAGTENRTWATLVVGECSHHCAFCQGHLAKQRNLDVVFMYCAGADPGFFLGGGAPLRNGVADW